MPETRTVEWEGEGLKVRLVVSRATVLIGTRRMRLEAEAHQDALKAVDEGNDDPDRALAAVRFYPSLIAATVAAEGLPWPPTLDEFLDLPEELWAAWSSAVYDLNPHWLPVPEEEQKKRGAKAQSTSTNGSKNGTPRVRKSKSRAYPPST